MAIEDNQLHRLKCCLITIPSPRHFKNSLAYKIYNYVCVLSQFYLWTYRVSNNRASSTYLLSETRLP